MSESKALQIEISNQRSNLNNNIMSSQMYDEMQLCGFLIGVMSTTSEASDPKKSPFALAKNRICAELASSDVLL